MSPEAYAFLVVVAACIAIFVLLPLLLLALVDLYF